jgi:hypothetical protein
MFVHHCTACQKRQLIFPSQVTAVAAGPRLSFTCWCGSEQNALVGLDATTAEEPVLAA